MYMYIQPPVLLKLLKIYNKIKLSASVPFVKLKEYLLLLAIMSPSILIVEVSLYHNIIILLYKSVAKLLGFVNG